jgi:DNA repair protein RadC
MRSMLRETSSPMPSQADKHVTKAIIQIATPLGISVHDHIIVGKNGHASLKGLKLIWSSPAFTLY